MEPGSPASWTSLLLVALLAFVVPVLLSRLRRVRVPVVVGEIVAGILVGRSGLGLINEDPWLVVLSNLGFTYLLFLAGLEIDFDLLSASARKDRAHVLRTFGIPVLYFVLMLVAGLGAAMVLQAWGLVGNAYLMALVLSTTSLGIVVPVLKERKLTGSVLGQSILLTTLLVDFGTMLLITLAVALEQGGPSVEILLVLVLLVAFFLVDQLVRRFQKHRLLSGLVEATAELGVRGSFVLIFVFVALAAQLGTEVVLGAFLAGALVSLAAGRGQGEDLRAKLDAIGFGFVVPIFFIMVGARFDLAALTRSAETLLLVPAFLGMRYLVKVLPALLFRFQFPWRETWAMGLILSPGLTLMIAASDIGLQAGLIGPAMNAAIILLAILTSVLSPLLFERVLPREPARRERLLVMIGASEHTLMLARHVREGEFDRVRFVERDLERAAQAEKAGFEVVSADATTEEGLARAGLHPEAVVVVATREDSLNLEVARLARERFGVENVVALASSVETAEALRRVGARPVTPALSTLVVLTNLIHDPSFFGLIEKEEVQVLELVLRDGTFHGRRIRDLQLPQGVLILSVHRGHEYLMPRGETRLRTGDRLTLAGQPAAVKAAAARLGG